MFSQLLVINNTIIIVLTIDKQKCLQLLPECLHLYHVLTAETDICVSL